MPNGRIFYAVQAIGFAPHTLVDGLGNPSGFITAHGVQSVGLTTTFNLEQIFELGQLDLYENIEGIPDIEVTAQKVLDGYPLLYHLATQSGVASASLVGRSNSRSFMALNIYNDTQDNASGTPLSTAGMSGLFVSTLTYTLNVEGSSTEDITLVGSDKVWSQASFFFLPTFDGTDAPLSLATSGGVQQREDILMGSGATSSLWPKQIQGINANGFNLETGDTGFGAHIQTVTISTDLGREELFELGKRGPFNRFVSFPVEVTCDIEVLSTEGDLIDAEADPIGGTNLVDERIKIFMREGSIFDLGTKNKLASVTYGGGDATGGNVTVTYSYSNFNNLKVVHPQDPAGQT